MMPEEQHELYEDTSQELRRPPAYDTHERERAWIKRHRDEYLGRWVALDGDRLIAHGPDARSVYLAARAAGVRAPFLEQVTPEEEDAFMGGWL